MWEYLDGGQDTMRATDFIFVEGLMGAGKSTMVERIVESLSAAGHPAFPVWEGPTLEEPDQPLRLSPTLPHPFAPWEDLTVEGYVEESLRRWRHYVHAQSQDRRVVVCDGLLFHGNMTDLMLMGASYRVLERYVLDVLAVLRPRRPVVVYLHRPDVAEGLNQIIADRGPSWEAYQVSWKLNSPYGRERGLEGLSGLVELYTSYRDVCDKLLQALPVPALQVERSANWRTMDRTVSEFLRMSLEGG
jgi:thymidylate kinase